MSLPPPTTITDSASEPYQAIDELFLKPFHIFAHKVLLPEHVQKIEHQAPLEQTGLVGGEATATSLVPTQSVLPLFDPVRYIAASVVLFPEMPRFWGPPSGPAVSSFLLLQHD